MKLYHCLGCVFYVGQRIYSVGVGNALTRPSYISCSYHASPSDHKLKRDEGDDWEIVDCPKEATNETTISS